MRARVYCSSVRSSNRRMSAICRNRRSAWSRSSRTSERDSAAFVIGGTLDRGGCTLPAVATAVTVPDLGEDVAAAFLIGFLVEPGGEVRRGQPLFEVDT